MTINSLFADITLMGVFLLIGFVLREVVKPLQKLFIPAAVLGGIAALLVGPQVFNLVAIPEESFSGMSIFINIIMACLVFGNKMEKGRAKSYLDYTLMIIIGYGLQLALGMLVGNGLRAVWPELPKAWGIMGVFSFWNGHTVAAPAGIVFQEYGIMENYDMGMILSTIGIIVSISVGMILVNYGVRKGYTQYLGVKDGTGKVNLDGLSGAIPLEKRKPVGFETVASVGINSLGLHLSMISLCIFVGNFIVKYIKIAIPVLDSMPTLVNGMLGALIVWNVMVKLKLDKYVDKKSVNALSGMSLELLILGAVATISVDLVTKFFLPIAIYSAVIVVAMLLCYFFLARRMFTADWYEKLLIAFGQTTGNSSSGLAVLRCVDPEMRSTAAEACGVGTTLWAPVYSLMPAVAPVLAMQSEMSLVGIGFAMVIVAFVLGRIFFWKKAN